VTVKLYYDSNNDGDFDDAGENTAIATTSTDGSGTYLFTNLQPGNYQVEVAPPSGYVSSSGQVGAMTGPYEPAPDADANPNNNDDNGSQTGTVIRSEPVTLSLGGEPTGEPATPGDVATDNNSNTTVDFGLFQPMSLGNLVWNDANDDGLVDNGETGIGGVTVNLYRDNGTTPNAYDASDTLIGSTTTNGTGHYLFTYLIPGDYVVLVNSSSPALVGLISTNSAGYEPAPDVDANPADNDDNGTASSAGVVSFGITLSLNTEPTGEDDSGDITNPALDAYSDTTVDFGFFAPINSVSLGNEVWIDANNDGLISSGENGLAGVTVKLYYDANNNGTLDGTEATTPIATTVTDALGLYIFNALVPGKYAVEIVIPSNYTSSTDIGSSANPDNDTDNDDNGVNISGNTARSNLIELTVGGEPSGNYNPTVDFGLVPTTTLSLGNLVWADVDNSGTVNNSESGIANVTVQLYHDTNGNNQYDAGTDTFVGSTVTDSNGHYLFTNLTPGDYVVVISLTTNAALNGYISSTGGGSEPAPDVDSNPTDNDDNGTTLGGLVVTQGVTLQPGTEPTNDGDTDSNSNLTVDFGFYQPADLVSLGNRVWLDNGAGGGTANDGLQNGGEPGVGGVTVNLYDSTGTTLLSTTTTDSNGLYLFSGLPEGQYVVEIILPSGYSSTTDTANSGDSDSNDNTDDNGVNISGTGVRSNAVTLNVGQEPQGGGNYNDTIDFGLVLSNTPLSLGNLVWNDRNNDGLYDADGVNDVAGDSDDEAGIAGVTVNLYRDADANGVPDGGVIATTSTDSDGHYRFDNLAPGGYVVEVVTPSGYVTSTGQLGSVTGPYEPAPGPNNNTDNDDNGSASGSVARSGTIDLQSGQETDEDGNYNPTVDFGFFKPLKLGDLVWIDTNNNGVVDSGENGIGGVTVRLYVDVNNNGTFDGGTDTLVGTTTTDGNGNYLFTNLTPGNYLVEVVIPDGYVSSSDIDTSGNPNNPVNNDDNGIAILGTSVFSAQINLADATGDNLRIDFGLYGPPQTPTITPTPGEAPPVLLDPILAKSPDLQTVQQGETVQFTITAQNPNNVAVNNVVVSDGLPDQISFTGASTSQGTFSYDSATNTVTFNLGTLGPNAIATMTVTGFADEDALPPSEFRNTASLSAEGGLHAQTTTGGEVHVIPQGIIPNTGIGPGLRELFGMSLLALLAFLLPVAGWQLWRRFKRRRT
jgi:uncharacterized repeat protein (TIGR01451 family)